MDFLERIVARILNLEFRDPFPAISKRPPGYRLEMIMWDRLNFTAMLAGVAATSGVAIIVSSVASAQLGLLMNFCFLAAAATVFVILRTSRPIIAGLRGERYVGHVLNELEKSGARILHDVPGENSNVDHIVICGAGDFAVETKYVGKPKEGKNQLTYDGENVRIGSTVLKNDGIRQALGCAYSVAKTLKDLGETQFVRGVVIFPGYYVKGEPKAESGVWASNENYFVKHIGDDRRRILSAADVERIYAKLCARLEQPKTLS